MYEYQARLIEMTDGDTAHAEVTLIDDAMDVGFGVIIYRHAKRRVILRLYGINTPEIKTPGPAGENATAFAKDWIALHCPDSMFTLNTFKTSSVNADDKTEKYGRYLALITAPDGHILNGELVAAGQAVPYFP